MIRITYIFHVIYYVDFDNLFVFEPAVLSLVLKIHSNEIHERPSGKTRLCGSDLSPASLLDVLAHWLTFTSPCSPAVALQLHMR